MGVVDLKVEVVSHVFDIPRRLQEIDTNLRVFYDTARDAYEVWGRDISGPYLLAKFDKLDQEAERIISRAYSIAFNTGRPYKKLLYDQEINDYVAEQQRLKRIADLQYGFNNDLRFFGKPVVQGATFRSDCRSA